MNAQTKKHRIAQLVASGLKAADVKLVVGVSEGYMRRLQEDEEFLALMKGYAAPDSEEAEANPSATLSTKESEHERLADRYTILEAKVVNQLIANCAMADTKELTSLLGTISKHRGPSGPPASLTHGVQTNIQINLTLPQSALGADSMQLSRTNEVIAVQGNSLAAMDTHGAQALLEKARAQRATFAPKPSAMEVFDDL